MAWSSSEWGSKARKENGKHTRSQERSEAIQDWIVEGFTPAEAYKMVRRQELREQAARTEAEWSTE